MFGRLITSKAFWLRKIPNQNPNNKNKNIKISTRQSPHANLHTPISTRQSPHANLHTPKTPLNRDQIYQKFDFLFIDARVKNAPLKYSVGICRSWGPKG
jgi:hypothetical protein